MTSRQLQARYRPTVRRAWLATRPPAPGDKDAERSWYRAQLQAAAGIVTTAGADPAIMLRLCEHFERLASPAPAGNPDPAGEPCPPLPFSPAQNAACIVLARKAHAAIAARGSAPVFSAWLDARIAEARAIPGNRFDHLMATLAYIANDAYWLDRTANSAERRIRHAITAKLAELSRLSHRELGWSYVASILHQAHLGQSLDDCPAQHLRSVLAMIACEIKRIMRKQSDARVPAPAQAAP